MRAKSLSDFQLYWSDDASPESDTGASCRQYIFEANGDESFNLRRVQSVQDALSRLSGSHRSADWFVVAGLALLYGNLVATGQWLLLAIFVLAGLLMMVLELRAAASFSAVALLGLLVETVRRGPSLHWLAAVGIQVLLALAALIVVLYLVQEDPRSYVLLRENPRACATSCARAAEELDLQSSGYGHLRRMSCPEPRRPIGDKDISGRVTIRNRCCMDIKLLVFDGDDFVRLVPKGGLLGGTLLNRGASCCVGSRPPYVVKVYAPWEIELGTFIVNTGVYSFRATAPPLALLPGSEQRFTNDTEDPVRIAVCRADCWCSSLWLPLAPQLARLAHGTTLVRPGTDVSLGGPCTIRVYDARLSRGLLQQASCRVRAGERAEFMGSFRWTPTRSSVGRSCSCILSSVS